MSQLGARLVKRLPVTRVVRISLLAMAVGGGGFLAAALTGHPPLVALLIPLFVFVASFGMMRPNATAVALANQGAIAGTASAWLGALPSCSARCSPRWRVSAARARRPWPAS